MSQIIVTVTDYQKKCKQKLPPQYYSYFASGSDDQITLKNNIAYFQHIYLAPRVLREMSGLSMKCKIFQKDVDYPFGFAPLAMQRLIHPQGEMLTAAEAFRNNVPYGLSMLTSTKISDVRSVNPSGVKILQLYFMSQTDYTKKILRIAEQHGFHALAITVDTQIFGKRRGDVRNNFSPETELEMFNELGFKFKFKDQKDIEHSFVHQLKNDLTWQDIKWIRSNTKLKIILKGVMDPDDVQVAQKCGVDAIWISNHGGRQLDTSPATILALPVIRDRINKIQSKMQLFVDGGIKKGSDIFKCLALGADFVFLGRGLNLSIIDGPKGVHNAFQILKNQLYITMMLCGTRNIKEITRQFILRAPQPKF